MATLLNIIDLAGRDRWINPDHVVTVTDTTPGVCVIRLVEGHGAVSTRATAAETVARLITQGGGG